MKKYGILLTNNQPNGFPEYWKDDDWQPLIRDNIKYKLLIHLDELTTAQINLFHKYFNDLTSYDAWLASTDIIPTVNVELNLVKQGDLDRKAYASSLNIDFKKNVITLNVVTQYFIGPVEQKELAKQHTLIIDGAFYGLFISQLLSSASLATVIQNIINQKDAEGVL